jgi:hypothetical protein
MRHALKRGLAARAAYRQPDGCHQPVSMNPDRRGLSPDKLQSNLPSLAFAGRKAGTFHLLAWHPILKG